MTERVIGHVGNLSESGMLLIANETLVDDALYQLQFALPGDKAQPETVEVGAHLLWMDRASAPGQAWIGLRFIAVAPAHLAKLQKWIEAPGGQYEWALRASGYRPTAFPAAGPDPVSGSAGWGARRPDLRPPQPPTDFYSPLPSRWYNTRSGRCSAYPCP